MRHAKKPIGRVHHDKAGDDEEHVDADTSPPQIQQAGIHAGMVGQRQSGVRHNDAESRQRSQNLDRKHVSHAGSRWTGLSNAHRAPAQCGPSSFNHSRSGSGRVSFAGVCRAHVEKMTGAAQRTSRARSRVAMFNLMPNSALPV
jgi:hypothetical protein